MKDFAIYNNPERKIQQLLEIIKNNELTNIEKISELSSQLENIQNIKLSDNEQHSISLNEGMNYVHNQVYKGNTS